MGSHFRFSGTNCYILFSYKWHFENKPQIGSATNSDVRFVLNWPSLGDERIESVLNSYESSRSLTGDHLDAYEILTNGISIDDRFGDDEAGLVLDSYTLLDAPIWYTLGVDGGDSARTVRFQLSVKNLTDEEYFSASGGDLRISIGTPRTVFGSVSFDF